MPFSTGTAKVPSAILAAINTLGTANGWVKLRGEPDLACASPKAARYWRMLWWETEDWYTDYRETRKIEFRETIGGAELPATWSASSGMAGLPNLAISLDINDQAFWIQADFGTPQTVRELYFQADTDNYAPRDFSIQWSNDGLTWTSMRDEYGHAWVDGEEKTFQFADGYINPLHVDANNPRRGGKAESMEGTAMGPADPDRQMSEDYWVWQLPGYDADTRIYLHARSRARVEDGTHAIQFAMTPAYDPARLRWEDQEGWSDVFNKCVYHLMDLNEVTYWAYINDHRLILVTKSGTDDYSSSYVGNLAAFSPPAEYPFPICMASTSRGADAASTTDNRISSACDPGLEAFHLRLWDGTWIKPKNRDAESTRNLYAKNPYVWVWPYHLGATDRSSWPYAMTGDWVTGDGHYLNSMIPTAQGDLPLFPCTVQDWNFGNLGYMDGMFAVPGGTLLPEQTFTIGASNYRVFCNRELRAGNNFFAVRED